MNSLSLDNFWHFCWAHNVSGLAMSILFWFSICIFMSLISRCWYYSLNSLKNTFSSRDTTAQLGMVIWTSLSEKLGSCSTTKSWWNDSSCGASRFCRIMDFISWLRSKHRLFCMKHGFIFICESSVTLENRRRDFQNFGPTRLTKLLLCCNF